MNISAGINFVDDIRARGYEPVLLEGNYVGTEEESAPFREARAAINAHYKDSVRIIAENPVSALRSMTEKDAMHEALKKNGLRYIKGMVVKDEAEAESCYRSLGTEDVVVKRVRGAGTQGVFLCHGLEETMKAVRESLKLGVKKGMRQFPFSYRNGSWVWNT